MSTHFLTRAQAYTKLGKTYSGSGADYFITKTELISAGANSSTLSGYSDTQYVIDDHIESPLNVVVPPSTYEYDWKGTITIGKWTYSGSQTRIGYYPGQGGSVRKTSGSLTTLEVFMSLDNLNFMWSGATQYRTGWVYFRIGGKTGKMYQSYSHWIDQDTMIFDGVNNKFTLIREFMMANVGKTLDLECWCSNS